MSQNDAIRERLVSLLERRFGEFALASSLGSVAVTDRDLNEDWGRYLDSIGVQRIGKLVGMCCEVETGKVRVADPLWAGGNQGFVEMHEETARRILTLGLP